ncbi:ABC transporter permease [Devosia sp. LjRoot16]|uniref:ABC transporter permease n=1 Tax=Devosia sp. LjRoot16 TaxID=3342271 RepID=UPI003ED0A3D4
MLRFIVGRVTGMIVVLFVTSIVLFAIIQLPAGDYLSTMLAENQGSGGSAEFADRLRQLYRLDQPFIVQYLGWIGGIVQGDLGYSFELKRPVAELIGSRLGTSLLVEGIAVIVMWGFAVPIGIYSAVRLYSIGDYTFTILGFLGLAIPNFLLGLLIMYFTFVTTGQLLGGLFSPQLADAPWSLAKLMDFIAHAWAPILVIATGGMAYLIRVMRANLIDELKKPYVDFARLRGLSEWRLILKYPVRIALNPLISSIGYVLPSLISSSIIVSVVFNLPTPGPMLLRALMAQDMYLAGALVLLMATLTIIGTFISDIILAAVDPRIRLA